MTGVFPDFKAPIVRTGTQGRELATARWGMPSSAHALMEATKKRAVELETKGKPVDFKQMLRMEPDGGTTNPQREVQTLDAMAQRREWGVVPFNSFSEFDKAEDRDIWFALEETPCASLLRRHLGQLNVVPTGQGRRDRQRPLLVPEDGAERRGRRHSSEGDADDAHDAVRGRPGPRPSGRGTEAAVATAGRGAADPRPRRQGRHREPRIGGLGVTRASSIGFRHSGPLFPAIRCSSAIMGPT
jgi:hypothetical protein